MNRPDRPARPARRRSSNDRTAGSAPRGSAGQSTRGGAGSASRGQASGDAGRKSTGSAGNAGGSRNGGSGGTRNAGSGKRPVNGGGRGGRKTSRPTPARTAPADFALPETLTPALPAVEGFEDLDLPEALLKTLAAQGVTSPFPIQAATLPNSLAGRDVLGRGRTGSGKTLAFGLALLGRTAGRRAEPGKPLALVLVPTRELAQQVTDALAPYATSVNLRVAAVVGGLSINKQAATLRRGVEVLVATPGRLKDLIDRGDCALGQVRVTVLDEADQMADMGFLPQVTALLGSEPVLKLPGEPPPADVEPAREPAAGHDGRWGVLTAQRLDQEGAGERGRIRHLVGLEGLCLVGRDLPRDGDHPRRR